jgi:peroxiredoxin
MCRLALLLAIPVALAQQSSSPFVPIPSTVRDQELQFGPQFPELDAKDGEGRTWRLEDLRGKFTLLYFWSTAEARMQDRFDHVPRGIMEFLDLPEVQRFYDKVKDAPNLRVLTFCRDYESGDFMRARDYMKQNRYTFPVVTDYVTLAHLRLSLNKLFPREWVGGPWLVNPAGQLAPPVHSWSLGRLLFEMERLAARN